MDYVCFIKLNLYSIHKSFIILCALIKNAPIMHERLKNKEF